MREMYQNPIAESILFLSLLVHMATGATLHYNRDRFGLGKAPTAPWYYRLQRHTGSALGAMVLMHLGGTRIPSFLGWNRLDDFAHLSTIFKLAPEFSFIYFGLYVLVAVVHLFLGTAQTLETAGVTGQGSAARICTHWLYWLCIFSTFASVLSGMYGIYSYPANLESVKYWLPIIKANVPSQVVTGTVGL
jgi:hypothetical protein